MGDAAEDMYEASILAIQRNWQATEVWRCHGCQCGVGFVRRITKHGMSQLSCRAWCGKRIVYDD